jgi:DMSO/TMAO reductase YedYZ molybdopterin-dependent catalytic subunit
MSFVTRGFSGRGRERDPALPPGQTLVSDWPVLSAGATPRIEPDDWEFTIQTETGSLHRWDWERLQAMPVDDVLTDIHCVTHWSKLGMSWRGVPLDAFFADIETSYEYVMAHSYGGYTTNLPLAEILEGQAWLAFEAEGEPLSAEHGGPVRLLEPHLYLWKSAKWLRGLMMLPENEPGFWESAGYHMHGDPWTEERYW